MSAQNIITANIFSNNLTLSKLLQKFFQQKKIKVQISNKTITLAHYNIFIYDPSQPSIHVINGIINFLQNLPKSNSKHILIVQQSNLTPTQSQQDLEAYLKIINTTVNARQLDFRTVFLWDLLDSHSSAAISTLDNLVKLAINTNQINITKDGNLKLFPLISQDFIEGFAKSFFTQNTEEKKYHLGGSAITDLDLALELKEVISNNSSSLEINQERQLGISADNNLESLFDKTYSDLNYFPSDKLRQELKQIFKIISEPDAPDIFTSPKNQSTETANSLETTSPIATTTKTKKSPLAKINFLKKIISYKKAKKQKKSLLEGEELSVNHNNRNWLKKFITLILTISFLLYTTSFILSGYFFYTSFTKLTLSLSLMAVNKTQEASRANNSSQRRLSLSQTIFESISSPLRLFSPKLTQDIDNLFLAIETSNKVINRINQLYTLSNSFISDSLAQKEINTQNFSLSLTSNLERLQFEVNQLEFISKKIKKTSFSKTPPFNKLSLFNPQEISSFKQHIFTAISISKLLPIVFPDQTITRYLVLIQDSNQYRPTGGAINAYLSLTFKGNSLIDKQIIKPSELNSQLDGSVIPPTELALFTGQDYFLPEEANFYPNFPDTAKQVTWFWKKIKGVPLDGIVAVNLDYFQQVLLGMEKTKIGKPKTTSKNLRFFISNMSRADSSQELSQLTNSILSSVGKKNNTLSLIAIQSLLSSATNSNLLVNLSNQKAENIISQTSFSGLLQKPLCPAMFSLVPCLSDIYYINEANYSANKSNFYQHRDITYLVDLSDAETNNKIKYQININYSYPTQAPKQGSDTYRALIRLYTSTDTTLNTIKLDDQVIPSEKINTNIDQDLQEISFPLNYSLNKNHKLSITFTSNTSLSDTDKSSYSLRIIKQPDTQNTTQEVVLKYPEKYIPTILSLPADLNSQIINFKKTPANNSYYAVSFTSRQD